MATVYLDGEYLPSEDARVSAFDAGLQHGVGLFETLTAPVRGGAAHALHLHEHLERLRASALTLGLTDTLRVAALGEGVQRTLARAHAESPGVARWRVRVTVTGGDLNLLARGAGAAHRPTLLIAAQPATEYPPAMFEHGTLAAVADLRVNPLDPMQGHKTLHYWPRLRELQSAAAKGAGEALVFSVTNHLAGGCVSNAFVVRGGELLTPIARGEEEEVADGEGGGDAPAGHRGAVLPSPVLGGIVRRWVMDWALSEGLACRRRMVTLDDVLRAEEVFLTNSSWGVLPVTRLEAETIAGGRAGEISRRLVRAWGELSAGG